MFATVRGMCSQSSAVVTASLLFVCAIQGALAGSDLKIRTVQRNSGSPVEMNPRTEEHILYLQGNRRRTEERREQRNPLWPGGPRVTFYEPHIALIESCDGDSRRAFSLNLDNRTYAPIEMSRKLTAEEIKALNIGVPKADTPTRATVLHEITALDTGERKKAFGYAARHVTAKFEIIRAVLREGTTYAVARLSVRSLAPGETTGPVSTSSPDLVQTTYIGKPETGFPIWLRTTMRHSLSVRGASREQVNTMESEVTELSAETLDPGLFEVPKNFQSVPRILPVPRAAVWARWLAGAHYWWVRSWRAIWLPHAKP